MAEDGLWLSRKQRRQFHQPRLRREHFGELVQIDGSEHRWFEDRGPRCTLIVFIDDATGRLVALRFVPSEMRRARREDQGDALRSSTGSSRRKAPIAPPLSGLLRYIRSPQPRHRL